MVQMEPADAKSGAKKWCQLGSLAEKLAVQLQLVRANNDDVTPFSVGDLFVSAPAPYSE